ncbi:MULTISPECIES: ornithine carbamoyltransferase [Deefgea]|uniref:Ornithine carbamoyltransferase n=1 Tax=Deefgea chitinilytica TaxID=570276 RepID=A0ABS2CBF8_9NEIS|nr:MULTISPECIES: ornithine carbamoyltransferase [Deefgea]MBM5571357.1 ornithine carbamoyltransferase [Deefgea chitinilytica]MBM9888590.1 ornithine carbamoyltransferase [Deefgea sp. CFH1-16]
MRHYLQFSDFTLEEYQYLFERTAKLKARLKSGALYQPLPGKVLGMIFEKSSTRTRVSFEAGMFQLGGHAMFLQSKDTQLGRGEPIEDVAKVMSRMVDIVMVRTFEQSIIERFAENSLVPVINGLTNEYHPCQIMADIFTYIEHHGSIEGKTVCWIGDSNNISRTWLQAAKIFNFKLNLACPRGYEMTVLDGQTYGSDVFETFNDPYQAARDADIVTTDVCTSMGYERETLQRKKDFINYKVSEKLMLQAKANALFMHCLPAHRGEEVDPEVIDGPQSVVWQEAENRMHTQKAVIEYLMLGRLDD